MFYFCHLFQETKERQELISHYEEKSSKLEKEAAISNDQLQVKIWIFELYLGILLLKHT